ncbi:PcfJ domain-containing protein [Kordia zhangzhouensis]|uniref:PcfJ domain-containing protein n=1 Tax=Kordia zhangzhouensis TaxID=1620405 RepID=UPI000629B36C|nr:PcfJ domain-containing protein [Kordia zhangzhouensis]
METQHIHRKHISKSRRLKQKLAEKAREKAIQESFQRHNQAKKVVFPAMVQAIYEGNSTVKYKDESLAQRIAHHFVGLHSKKDSRRRKAFKELLDHLYQQRCTKLLRNREYLQILYQIAWFSLQYQKDVKTWKRKSYNEERQLKDLISHCFVKYEVPVFMYDAWLTRNRKYISWFIDLASGYSVKKLSKVPVYLSKKGAHYFLQAPASYSIEMALRRAQALAFGADEVTADRIAHSYISRNGFSNEAFWETVIQFFAKQTMLDFRKMNEIIDYLSDCIRDDASYSIKGRTINSLTRQSDEWHAAQAIYEAQDALDLYHWEPTLDTSFVEFQKKGSDVKKFRLFELCSSEELIKEGNKMNHCVASYAYSCVARVTGIFSLRCMSFSNGNETLATIEVNINSKKIVQAKARFNKPISAEANRIMKTWATQHELAIGKWL